MTSIILEARARSFVALKRALGTLENMCRNRTVYDHSVFTRLSEVYQCEGNPYAATANELKLCKEQLEQLEDFLKSENISGTATAIRLFYEIGHTLDKFLDPEEIDGVGMLDLMVLESQPDPGHIFAARAFVEHLVDTKVAWLRCRVLFDRDGTVEKPLLQDLREVSTLVGASEQNVRDEGSDGASLQRSFSHGSNSSCRASRDQKASALITLLKNEMKRLQKQVEAEHGHLIKEGNQTLQSLDEKFTQRYQRTYRSGLLDDLLSVGTDYLLLELMGTLKSLTSQYDSAESLTARASFTQVLSYIGEMQLDGEMRLEETMDRAASTLPSRLGRDGNPFSRR
ncbi:hypothetical protein QFC24_004098 [Naganishia onofrii]|uniref:Uncharacterized protein n=1 Tax=Naganishia onofrii TaxID=1851511 RepID=A0ACC2XGZ9_9TREE|nr:hypothetical protein QFC24_004098 [Naganishia onofrii]